MLHKPFISCRFLFLIIAVRIMSYDRAAAQVQDTSSLDCLVDKALDFALQQSVFMAQSLKDCKGLLPRTADRFGNLETCDAAWWTSGFFPGMLWYLYEYSENKELEKWAREFTDRVEEQQYTTDNHDVGFIINNSAGHGYRITHDTAYRNILLRAARSLSTRFRTATGCIRSWDHAGDRWQYPVIIDNMMNLELLLVAAREFNEPHLRNIAITHANTTLKNHFRPDNSSFHVLDYDTVTGLVLHKHTAQGFSHQSAWARGQAWGLYGFTMMYRLTGDTTYLDQAKKIAGFIIHHPRLPEDKIPYWDFDAPNIPDCYRDASAAAILCSALIELSGYVDPGLSATCLSVAEKQLRTLSSDLYRNAPANNGNFILKHSVGHLPGNSEVDVPLIYADYYYLEALIRMNDKLE
jgi:rhamnogalacturonyl hydrolase YesR